MLQMCEITKRFGQVTALRDVDFDVRTGEVHALIGENGAGKSTLMNVLAGRFNDYTGQIVFQGKPVRLVHPRQALDMGIGVIYQELSVLDNFTVAENIMLGEETARGIARRMDRHAMHAEAQRVLDYLGFDLDIHEPVEKMSTARKCLVEIAHAVRRNVRVLIFDEPTASLGSEDVDKLFSVINELKQRGMGIVYITHRLAELPRIADRVTVLRDARKVGERSVADCKVSEMTRLMLGRDLTAMFPQKHNQPGDVMLRVRQLARSSILDDISFDVRAGEILGLAGLVGSGRTEIVRAIIGADCASGEVEFDGRPLRRRTPARCSRAGIMMVPENRKQDGNITGRSLAENVNASILGRLTSSGGYLSPRRLEMQARQMIDRMQVDPPDPLMQIQKLSGGNQQKVIVGRSLAAEPKLIIFDEPTQGIDIGTKAQIYRLIVDLAARGCAVLLISSEMIEITELADRIIVVRRGRVTRELDRGVDEDALFNACTMEAAA